MKPESIERKPNFKDFVYRVEHKTFEIVVLHDQKKSQLELFFKTNRMTHFRPLMDGERWLTFPGSGLFAAVHEANCAANGFIADFIEKGRKP